MDVRPDLRLGDGIYPGKVGGVKLRRRMLAAVGENYLAPTGQPLGGVVAWATA